MYQDGKIWVGTSGDEKVYIYPKMANRHGLIAGATGTGKTVTLKVLAESFSDCGVPVFLADVKGDLAAMCRPGQMSESLQKRIEGMQLAENGFEFRSYPATYWDIYGEKGMPLRTTQIQDNLLYTKYVQMIDCESAYEILKKRVSDEAEEEARAKEEAAAEKLRVKEEAA